ncbi:MAG: choice-of-anchor B family protein [Armatimonadetes bacterium]|nr:choice-of-anchor B family protein [Armatimonadota bacterium]
MTSSFQSSNMQLHSRLSIDTLAGKTGEVGSAIWGWVDPLTSREYALYGISNGTAFVDVTAPAAPVYLGLMATNTGTSPWRELQTYNNHLYVVSDGNGAHGMQIFDLTRLRGATTAQSWTPNTTYNGVTNTHTITINETTGYAFLNGSSAQQQVLNLASPLSPTSVLNYAGLGYVHDSTSVVYHGPDAAHVGKEIVLNSSGGSGLEVVNFTNHSAPVRLSTGNYPNLGYTHQGSLTDDHRFFIVNDEFDEWALGTGVQNTRTHIWDLADLDSPAYLGYYEHPSIAIDHNLFIKGSLLFESNYTVGLRVFDLSALWATNFATLPLRGDGTKNLQSVLIPHAFFDTYNQDDLAPERSFNGQWGNYPFLPSGTILAGDRNNGLFVLSLGSAPEPSSLLLLVLGSLGGGMALYQRRR